MDQVSEVGILTGRPIPAMLDAAVRDFPDRPAIEFLGRTWRYRELDALVARAAKGLQEQGVGPGTRVGLCLPNAPYFVIFYFAVLRAGGIVVNFNPLYVERELIYQINDSGTEVMITIDLAVIYPKVRAVAGRTALRRIIVCPMAGALPPLKGLLFRLLKRRDLATVANDGMALPYAELMRNDGRPAPVAIDPAQTAILQYTGGTTGVPKAAELTHANITINCAQVRHGLGIEERGTARVVGVLPLFHVFALTCVMSVAVETAALMILLPRFELRQLLDTLTRLRPTMFPAVPTLYAAINEAATREKLDLSSIRQCMSGGAPLPMEVRARFVELTGAALMEGYGLSETSPVACFTPPSREYRAGSVGLPVVGSTVEIRDPDHPERILGPRERGEVCIRGPQVMRGYWNRPDETARAMTDGALRTGDVGYLDEDGYLYLVDRIKDLIIAGGYNIYPRVLEEALYQHPAVKEAVVIGIPDAYRGQAPKAFVTLQDGQTTTPDELRAFMADHVSKIEMPKLIEIRDSLPKTTVGKLSKKELVAEEAARSAG